MKLYLKLLLLFYPFLLMGQVNADFTFNPSSGCNPLIVSFTDASTGGPTSWQWNFGNGNGSIQPNPGAIYTTPGTYDVQLIVSDGITTDTIIIAGAITVFDDPVISIAADVLTGCAPLQVNFQNTSIAPPGIASTIWNFGDGNASVMQNPTNTYDEGIWDISVIVTDSAGCESQEVFNDFITAVSGPSADFTATGNQTCGFPANVNFQNTSTNDAGATYEWDFGDGSPTSTLENPMHVYNATGNYDVQLIVTADNCPDTITQNNFVIIDEQTADFTVDLTSGCAGDAFSFTDLSILQSNDWIWDFGDGSPTSSMQNPVHTYNTPGTYTVSMVSVIPGCSDSISLVDLITINPNPSNSFTVDTQFACSAPLNVNFTPMASPGVSFNWNFGDGNLSMQQNATHTYTMDGTFSVSLTTTTAQGCSFTSTQTNLISISDPTATFGIDSAFGCAPVTSTFNDFSVSNGTITNWIWDFGDGSPVSNNQNPTHTYSDTGFYSISLIIEDDLGCTDTILNGGTVEVGEPLGLNFEATPILACKAEEIVFTNLSDTSTNAMWFWEFGDGGTDVSFSPTYTYGDTGIFDVSLVGINNGCVTDTTFENYMTIFPPIALFDIVYNCDSFLTVQFDDRSIGAETWTYVIETGDSLFTDTALYTFPALGDFDVTLYVENLTVGCIDSVTQTVTITQPIASFTQDTTMGCPILPIQFTSTSQDAVGHSWNFGDGNISGGPTPLHNYTTAGIFDVRLIVTDVNGCRDTTFSTTPINTLNIEGNFIADTTAGCRPFMVNFSDISGSSGGNIVNWAWDFGDGSPIVNTQNPTHVFNDLGLFTVSLAIENASGCLDTITLIDYINVLGPEPNFVVPNPICAGGIFQINDLSVGTNLEYFWDFGDGSPIDTNMNPLHVYPNVGDFTVTLQLIDDNLCDTTFVSPDSINVSSIAVDFMASDTIDNCPPFAVDFTNLVVPAPSAFNWDFGDGNGSTLPNPSHIYNDVGFFDVTLIASNIAGCIDTFTLPNYIEVQGPFGDVAVSPTIGCTDLEVLFELTNTNSTGQTWDFGDGNVVDTIPTVEHTYTNLGIYNPVVVLTDSNGCSIFYPTDSVIVGSLIADFNSDIQYVCTPDFVQFTDNSISSGPINNWWWDFGTGDTSNQANPLYSYGMDGVFDVTLIVENDFCTDTLTLNQFIVSDSSTIANFEFQDSIYCPPVEIVFSDLSSTDSTLVSWMWDFGDGSTESIPNPSHSYTNPGTYFISLTVETNRGCLASRFDTVVVDSLPSINLPFNDTTVCVGATFSLDSLGSDSYSWSPDIYISCTDCPDPEFLNLDNPDSVIYTIYAENIYGCLDSTTYGLTILSNPQIQVSQDQTVLSGTQIQMTAFSPNNVDFNWSPDSTLSCNNCTNPQTTITENTTFVVSIADQFLCNAADSISIEVFDRCVNDFLKFPNVFTPNNDDKNDIFLPFRLQNLIPPINYFRVFDRWGKLIYETNDITKGWDGTFNGNKMNNGVYVYTLEIDCFDGSTDLKRGNVTLIR